MNLRQTTLAVAVVSALFASALPVAAKAQTDTNPDASTAQAQSTQTTKNQATSQKSDATKNASATNTRAKKVQQLQAIQVYGISQSLSKSLAIKQAANSIVDAVTAEGLSKFPNTDVAEAMTQIPGVTIDRIFGQGSSVSIDGTDPSLNLTFLDGHQVAQMGWLGAGQSRGFDYTILPPQLVSSVVVYKTSQARLPEGSIGGTVMVNTRKPLDLNPNTLDVSLGGTMNAQYKKAQPNGALLYSWRNPNKTFGVLVSASYYEQQIDRQGSEIFSYFPASNYVNAPNAAGSQAISPSEINSAYFLQTRKRDSLNFDVESHPIDNLTLNLNGLYLRENYNNVNQSMYTFAQITPANVNQITAANGVVNSLHVCSDVFSQVCSNPATTATSAETLLDSDPRVSSMTIKGMYLSGDYNVGTWGVHAQLGVSSASNPTTLTYADEGAFPGGYTMNLFNGSTFDDPTAAHNPENWLMGGQNGSANFTIGTTNQYNRMTNANFDFHNDFDSVFNRLNYGFEYNTNYVRVTPRGFVADDPRTQTSEASFATGGLTDILSQFAGFSPDMQHRIALSPEKQIAFQKSLNYRELASSLVNGKYVADETDKAVYVQQDFIYNNLSGNFGLRYVYTGLTASAYQATGPASFPIPQDWWKTEHSGYHKLLPSVNLVYTPSDRLTLRAAAAKVMARQQLSSEVPTLSLNAQNVPPVGSGGNVNLLPYSAYNYSVAGTLQFGRNTALSAEAFFIRVNNYILQAPANETHFSDAYLTEPQHFQQLVDLGFCDATNDTCVFSVSRPENKGSGRVRGFDVAYQTYSPQYGVGLITSFTYSNGVAASGGPLPYNSKYSVNFSPYYEKGPFSFRLTYTWRSKYFTAGYQVSAPSTFVNDYDDLDMTATWTFNKHWAVTLSALNMTNARYYQYNLVKSEPANRYYNGTLYMATANFKL